MNNVDVRRDNNNMYRSMHVHNIELYWAGRASDTTAVMTVILLVSDLLS